MLHPDSEPLETACGVDVEYIINVFHFVALLCSNHNFPHPSISTNCKNIPSLYRIQNTVNIHPRARYRVSLPEQGAHVHILTRRRVDNAVIREIGRILSTYPNTKASRILYPEQLCQN
jgi:hypothetical protein